MDIELDKSFREVVYPPVCSICLHFRDIEAKTCDAFANGIPLEIWNGKNNHRQPYSGDNGIQFEPLLTIPVDTGDSANGQPPPSIRDEDENDAGGSTV